MPYGNNNGKHLCSLISVFGVCYLDSIIPTLAISQVSRLKQASVSEQASSILPGRKSPKTRFPMMWLKWKWGQVVIFCGWDLRSVKIISLMSRAIHIGVAKSRRSPRETTWPSASRTWLSLIRIGFNPTSPTPIHISALSWENLSSGFATR